MNCPREDFVFDGAMGELQGAELRELHQHLESCSYCANTYDELMGTAATLSAHRPEVVSLPLAAKATLQRRLNTLYEGKKPWYSRWFPQLEQRPALTLGLCAALIVYLFLGESEIMKPRVLSPQEHRLVIASVTVHTLHGEARSKGALVSPQQKFAFGDELSCEKDARLNLDWCGRGEVLVEGATDLRIKADGIALSKGTVHCSVEPTSLGFYVRTANVDVAVVGTHFTVTVDEKGQTNVDVSEGQVAVTDKKTMKTELLSAGDGSFYETEPEAVKSDDESGTDSALSTTEASEKGSTDDKAVVLKDNTVVEEEKEENEDNHSTTIEEGF